MFKDKSLKFATLCYQPETIGAKSSGGGVQHFWIKKGDKQIPRVDRADGIYIWDTDGNRYLDASSGPVVCNLGHGNSYVLDAMKAQAQRVTFCYPSIFESEANTELSNLLCELAGPGLDRAFFVSGGSEAIELSIKFARHYALATDQPQKTNIISRIPSYHGSTLGALAITGEQYVDPMFSKMLKVMPKIPAPSSYRVPEGFTIATYAEYCAQALEDEILRLGPETVLGFVMEPIIGVAGGASFAPDSYYSRIRDICSTYGVLLIFDEVMTGAGRTGKFLAAHHWPEAMPDIVVMAKGFSAGYFPLGAMMVSNEILDPVVKNGGFHMGHTAKTSPLGCAVGLAVMEELVAKDLINNAANVGGYLRAKLRFLMSEIPILGDVRGKGLLNAIELVVDRNSMQKLPDATNILSRVITKAKDLGLLLYARKDAGIGDGDWLMITPPLIITAGQIDELVDLLLCALKTVHDDLVSEEFL